jgi:hypothetical protein
MCCPPVNQQSPRPMTGELIEGLIQVVVKVQTELYPFCEEGHSPHNFHVPCEFCKGMCRLAVGEAAEISQRLFEESRS